MNTTTENLSTPERAVRFLISLAAILLMMQIDFVGSAFSGVSFIIAIALATTAITGWDPLKSLSLNMKSHLHGSRISQKEKHA